MTLILGLVLALILLAGCGSGAKQSRTGEQSNGTQAENKDPYIIGVLTAQTGSASWLGDPELKVSNLLVDQVNAEGGINGHQVKIIPYDTTSTPEQAVNGANKLIADGAVAIIGPSLVAESKAVAPLVKNKGPLVYALSAVYKPENHWMFGTGAGTDVQQQTILNYFKKKGISKIAVLASTDSTGQEGVDVLNKLLPKEPSIKVVALERINPADVDVTVQLNKIKNQQPQAIIAWMTGKLVNVAVKNFYQSGLEVPLVVSAGNLSYKFINGIEDYAPKTLLMAGNKNFVWETLPDSDPQKAVNEKLAKSFKAKYNLGVDIGPAMAHDAMAVVLDGLRKVGPDKEKLRSYLETVQNYPGSTAVINLSPEDHRGIGLKDDLMLQVKDGKVIPAE